VNVRVISISLLQGLQYRLFVTVRNVGPPLRQTHRHAEICFAPAFTLVSLFVCYFGVKQHAHRTESQNNAAFLATSYESVIEGGS